MVTRMRDKGQITIPANIRDLLTPKPSVFEAVSDKFSKAAKSRRISLADLLTNLKKIRHKEA